VATAARSPSPSGGSEKADGQDRRDAEGAPAGQELPAELILPYLASGCRVNRTQATAALSELISVGLLGAATGAALSVPKAPAPASPPASHRRGGPPHRSLPDAGVTYREHPADVDVGLLLEAADQLQARDESEML
jgi:hypothetical protein